MNVAKTPSGNAQLAYPSNLECNLKDLNTPKRIKKQNSRWNFGNEKKRRELVKTFVETATVHGTHFIYPKKNTPWVQKFIYRVLFLICILGVLGSISVLLQDTFGRETTFTSTINKDIKLGKEEDPDFFPDYPRMTICRQPFFKTDLNDSYLELVEYAFLALGYPFIPFTPEERSMAVDISMKDNKTRLPSHIIQFEERLNELEERFRKLKNASQSFDLKQFVIENSMGCEDLLLLCAAMVFPLDCCKIFKPILTSMGLCYTLEDTSDFLDLIGSSSMEFSLSIDLIQSPPSKRKTEDGFNLYFTHPLEVPIYFKPEDGKKITTGVFGYLNAQVVKTDRSALYTDWTTLTDSCPNWPSGVNPFKAVSNLYSYRNCDTYAHFVYLRNTCKCESIFFPGNATMRYCEPRDLYICFLQNAFGGNYTTATDMCFPPCISYQYKFGNKFTRVGSKNVSRILITYNSENFENHEYRTATMSSLLSQIGGSLGLYLGASIVSVVEIIIFVASWLWYRICLSKKTKVHQEPAISIITTRNNATTIMKRYI